MTGMPAGKILLSGSTGLIGRSLMPVLASAGYQVVPLLRQASAPAGSIAWNPIAETMDPAPLQGIDAVIHLGGENLAQGRWTAEKKKRIRDSRVHSTALLADTIRRLRPLPRVFLCASATGFYGDRGDEELTEESPAGKGFVADVCQEWEAASKPAAETGIQVVHLRLGVVLSAAGGALAKMLMPFKLGLGGPIGNGRQYLAWISLADGLAAMMHLLDHSRVAGPVNMVAPQSITFRQFARTLGRVLHRPAVFSLPAPIARLVLGEMADQLLLASTRVVPRRLAEDGFVFQQPDLETALRQILAKNPA
jgi:uncharacterized protein